ncbi:MAG TPA: cupin domain-containing protein [Candidatus Acidoferrum sp.]|nr:cupin domain-containing protein [Candidatus Acidoferrum sp.]
MDESNRAGFVSRRGFLGSAALGAAALSAAAQMPQDTQKAEHDRSGTNPIGPDNPSLHDENPDSVVPPITDHGNVETFKYPFSLSHKRTQEGGWARQVTVEDLPVATEIAGVNMRLTTGGVRELHWHKAAEWSIMLYGNARVTCLDQNGKAFVDDIKQGDLWLFPVGYPHSIQGLGPDGCEFILAFDDGHFSEYDTVLLSDFVEHIPRNVLAKNFNVEQRALDVLPKQPLYIFQTKAPQTSLEEARRQAAGNLGLSPETFTFHMSSMVPTYKNEFGEARIVDSRNFKVNNAIAMAHVTVHPEAMRELHWHQNADEWQYYIAGKARMTVFGAQQRARTMDFQKGDIGYIKQTFPHYIENTGSEDLVYIELFKDNFFQDVSLNNWLTHLPPALVQEHLNISAATLNAIPHREMVNVGYKR